MNVASPATGGGVAAKASLGAARFLLQDGSEAEFVWPALEEAQLASLKVALDGVLPGRWRPVDELRAG